MNKNITFLFIVKNNLYIQFSPCHTSDENVLMSNFSQTTVCTYVATYIHTYNYYIICNYCIYVYICMHKCILLLINFLNL